MSEKDENGWVIEQRTQARQAMAKALGEYADAHDVTAGGICTGYVVVMEITVGDGRACIWMTGNGGTPDDDYTEGLDSWRVEGMVRHILRDLDAQNVSRD